MARMKVHLERLVYRIGGLPIAVRALIGGDVGDPASIIRSAFADQFWHPNGTSDWLELTGSMILWPVALVLGAAWFTLRNGAVIREREHRSIPAQLADQARLYFSSGMLAPWYYIFSLHRGEPRRHVQSYLQRCETKRAIFMILRGPHPSPLADKKGFADHCREHGVRCVPYVAHFDGSALPEGLPDCDLFVKPVTGRGGTGAERWDRVDAFVYSGPDDMRLSEPQLREHLQQRARHSPLIVQQRLTPHPDLADLTTGALPTVRMVTCLNEAGEPELVGAVFRMAIGSNTTVDNLHAGGIASAVALDSGTLSNASNLGADAHLGWLSRHPNTGTTIVGRQLPSWAEAKALALEAHRSLSDRIVVGWDIAIIEDGPIIVEGNGSPDMDIMQRFAGVGICEQRFGNLLAHHLRALGYT